MQLYIKFVVALAVGAVLRLTAFTQLQSSGLDIVFGKENQAPDTMSKNSTNNCAETLPTPMSTNSWQASNEKTVVMAKMSTENTDWVPQLLPDWHAAIYHMDLPTSALHPPMNKGREAMAYLTYLIDNYHNLSSITAFIHPHNGGWPEAWHTDAPNYSNAASLNSLRLEHVQTHGYVNLRCIADPGCPAEIQPFREPHDPARTAEHAMTEAWTYMFGGDDSGVPVVIAQPCCSQFAVARDQILRRPVSDYERYRQWLIDTPLDDQTSGRVMEYLWHIFFGKEAVYCPDLGQCWCEQFGRC